MVIRVILLEQPRVDDGKVRRHDGEKQEENADDLRYVETVTGFQEVGQKCQTDYGCEDDDPCQCFCPRFFIMGEHLEDHLESLPSAAITLSYSAGREAARAISTAV